MTCGCPPQLHAHCTCVWRSAHDRLPVQDEYDLNSGVYVQRQPAVFKADIELAQEFFHALASEPAGVRASVQEAINHLAAAYKDLPTAEQDTLKQMLTAQSRSAADGVRLCAVNWACSVFERSDPFAKHVCIMASSDAAPEVHVCMCLMHVVSLFVCHLISRPVTCLPFRAHVSTLT